MRSAVPIGAFAAAFPLQPHGAVVTLVALTLAVGSLRIQIHDYANVPCGVLSRASESVTATFDRIGVHTEWIGVVRHGQRGGTSLRRADGASQDRIAPLTIIILTPTMAARAQYPEGVLGLAAVAPEGRGRIAFVVYDRVKDVALKAEKPDDAILGYVMAHEIAHLLLPAGSHDAQGLMRSRWSVPEFARVDVLALEFSPLQASQIRQSVETHHRRARAADASTDAHFLTIGHSC